MGLKVIHLLYSGPGGLGTYFRAFVESDLDREFEHYAYWYGNVPLYGEYEAFCEEKCIPYSYRAKEYKVDMASWLHCARWIKEQMPEGGVVLLHTFSLTPTVLLLGNSYKIVALEHSSFAIKTKFDWWCSRYIHNHHVLIYFYPEQVGSLRQQFGKVIRDKPIYLLPKTVNTQVFQPAEKVLVNDKLMIGMASRINSGKRHDLLLELATWLKEQNTSAIIKVAGEGPFKKEFVQLAESKDLNTHIQFVGLLDRSTLVKFYQSLDIYIHATDGETICYSIMEAQACGLPVAASKVEGVSNALEDRKEGVLFQNTSHSLISAIQELFDGQRRMEMGEHNRQVAVQREKKYNNPKMLKKILIQE